MGFYKMWLLEKKLDAKLIIVKCLGCLGILDTAVVGLIIT